MPCRHHGAIALLAVLAALWSTPAFAQPSVERDPAPRVDPRAQLMITDLRVVEDPVRTDPRRGDQAAWSFRHLVEAMAGPNDPSQLVMRWLRSWEADHVVNGRVLPARPAVRELVLEPWLARSGGRRLDLDRAPFQLLAIVNRMDLREHDGPEVQTAGEGRFVFGVLGPDGRPLPPVAGPAAGGFLVIFEYELVARDMDDLRRWTREWIDLGRLPLGSPDYNRALERITRRFTDAGRGGSEPDGSALNQVRTNEIALAAPWELREFVLDDRSGLLVPHVVAQTPDTIELNGTPELAGLINRNEASLLAGDFDVPPPLLGPSSLSGPFREADFPDLADRTFRMLPLAGGLFDAPWSAAGVRDNDARHAFAVNTCNGCHRSETGTGFVHVQFPPDDDLPASLGRPAALSGFLTGIALPDPVDASATRTFADLERRRIDLIALARSFALEGGGDGPVRERRHPHFVH